jgi:hypothetical protein
MKIQQLLSADAQSKLRSELLFANHSVVALPISYALELNSGMLKLTNTQKVFAERGKEN